MGHVCNLPHADQDCSHRPAEEILSAEGVVEFAGHERQPVILLGLEDSVGVLLGDEFRLAHFIGVGGAIGMDSDYIAPGECAQVDEGAGLAAGVEVVTREDGIARPGGEGGAIQPADVAAQPGDVPAVHGLWYAADGGLHVEIGDVEPQIAQRAVVFVFRLR